MRDEGRMMREEAGHPPQAGGKTPRRRNGPAAAAVAAGLQTMGVRFLPLLLALSTGGVWAASQAPGPHLFRAGAATSNITPRLGSSINGGMRDVTALHVHDELHARCLVLDDGRSRI